MNHFSISLAAIVIIAAMNTTAHQAVAQNKSQLKQARSAILRAGGRIRGDRQTGFDVELQLAPTPVSDEILRWVVQLKNVTQLNLRDSQVTHQGLAALKRLPSLKSLHLERTSIDDRAIQHLAGLKQLQYLNLYQTRVSDASLSLLTKLPKLRKLYIWQTRVTKKGVSWLSKQRRDLQVIAGVDLSQFSNEFPPPAEKQKLPSLHSMWYPIADHPQPTRSKTGINTEVYFKSLAKVPLRLYWIGYDGKLKLYGQLDPGKIRIQNSYANNAWLVTTLKDQPLGYFVVGSEPAMAIVPKEVSN